MNRWLETQKRQSDRLMILLAIANKAGYTLVEPPHFIDYDRFRAHSADLNPSAWIKLNNPEGRVVVGAFLWGLMLTDPKTSDTGSSEPSQC